MKDTLDFWVLCKQNNWEGLKINGKVVCFQDDDSRCNSRTWKCLRTMPEENFGYNEMNLKMWKMSWKEKIVEPKQSSAFELWRNEWNLWILQKKSGENANKV